MGRISPRRKKRHCISCAHSGAEKKTRGSAYTRGFFVQYLAECSPMLHMRATRFPLHAGFADAPPPICHPLSRAPAARRVCNRGSGWRRAGECSGGQWHEVYFCGRHVLPGVKNVSCEHEEVIQVRGSFGSFGKHRSSSLPVVGIICLASICFMHASSLVTGCWPLALSASIVNLLYSS
jgi:hypothetical protein